MTRAGIALGSNVGDRMQHLRVARDAMSGLAAFRGPLLASGVYETEPVDCEPGCRNFLNAVVEIGYDSDALELLHELRMIEARLGRPAAHQRNAPRTVDLDLLYFGQSVVNTSELQLPHPRMHERRFVLLPLADIRAEMTLPARASVATLLAVLPQTPAVVRADVQW
jgi:2-amino-4-hydroxy-6-hydroxymethyldihydropteridine diphosphokinase